MGLFLSELTLAISQRTFGLYSETCLIRHYAEPNNYVGFDGVSEYSGVSITRTNVVLSSVNLTTHLYFFVIESIITTRGKKTISTHKLNANTCSVRLYLQVSVGGFMSYLRYLCLLAYSGVQHILCYVFVLFFLRVVYPLLSVSLDCPYWYSLTFI
jgi:hypothetical protein